MKGVIDEQQSGGAGALSYKGQYVEENLSDEPFICAITGAHFDFEDMCRMLLRVKARR